MNVLLVASESNRQDYRARQLFANEQGADLYVSFHFNAKRYDKPGVKDNPASCLVANNASPTSREMARDFAKAVSDEFSFPNRGLVVLDRDDRGYYNLYYTAMPAFLIEPFYVSDKEQAALALSEGGQRRVAQVLVDVIRSHMPEDALIAFDLGHKFKVSSIHDRGAPVVVDFNDEGDPIYHQTMAEADCAEKVMHYAKAILEGKEESIPPTASGEETMLVSSIRIEACNEGPIHVRYRP